ncbi:hypothetical protein NMG60_11036172 [Bertholletia excelsa]
MAAVLVCLAIFLAMAGHSNAAYCVCKDGLSDSVYQKNIDYSCGAGADCTPILQNGACYNPNTMRAHCDYAVNSYYQKKSQTGATCDFSGTATLSQSVSNQGSGCVYPSSATGTSTTPTTTPSTTPTTTPTTGTTTPSTGTITPSTGTTTSSPSVFGLAPTGTTIGNTDNASVKLHHAAHLLWLLSLTVSLLGPTTFRV